MSVNYPTSLDSFTNPTGTDLLENSNSALDHDVQHSNANDAIEALQAKVGANSSAVATSHDYKLSEVTSTDKAVGKTAVQTLINKTLTSPVINVGSDATGDFYYRNGSGGFTRLPAGTDNQIIIYQSGIPTVQNNPSGSDASTTVKGVVELATYAETIARTTTGATGAKLVVTPDNLTTVLTYDYQADAGGTDTYAITCTPAPTAYATGMEFTFKANTANTGVATLNVNSLGAKSIKFQDRDLYTGEILANQIVKVSYDGTNMNILSQPATYALSQSTFETVTSANIRTTNNAAVTYGASTPTSYTLMKEILFNDVGGTVSVTYQANLNSGSGSATQYSRIYVNGVAVGTERVGQGTFTETITVATGDLIQIYGKVVYVSGSLIWEVKNMTLAYDKQLKQTFITNTTNS